MSTFRTLDGNDDSITFNSQGDGVTDDNSEALIELDDSLIQALKRQALRTFQRLKL